MLENEKKGWSGAKIRLKSHVGKTVTKGRGKQKHNGRRRGNEVTLVGEWGSFPGG